jgi:hypothetical protein
LLVRRPSPTVCLRDVWAGGLVRGDRWGNHLARTLISLLGLEWAWVVALADRPAGLRQRAVRPASATAHLLDSRHRLNSIRAGVGERG